MSVEISKEPDSRIRLQEAASVFTQLAGLCGRMKAKRAVVFLTRVACKPVSFFKWFSFLSRFEREHRLGSPSDYLLRKKSYKFFARRLRAGRGFDLLADHFVLAGATLRRDRLEAAWRGHPTDIGTVVGKRDAYTASMHLAVLSAASHEGAFSVTLTRQSDRLNLVKLTFILYKLPGGGYTVAIGGIQGGKQAHAKRAVIEATRDLGGLRPKDAALLVMEGIAQRGGADHVLGVSDARHTINYRATKNRVRKHSDLDDYWLDRGGYAGGEFGFIIPARNREIAVSTRRDAAKLEFLEIGRELFVPQPLRADPGTAAPIGNPLIRDGEA